MFAEREIRTNFTCIAAAVLWAVALALWGLSWVFGVLYLTGLSIIVCAAAATLTARGCLISHAEQIKTALIVTGRVDPKVRPIDQR